MKVVVLGGGISGHTAALILRRKLPQDHEVVVVTPNSQWNWIPSNIWVGTGRMTPDEVTFPLAPVYTRAGITYIRAKATEIWPEGSREYAAPHIKAESTEEESAGAKVTVDYDFLINATGPKLNFEATPGLGPDQFTHSVCTYTHAHDTSKALASLIEEMKRGATKTFVVGTGHGTCTCEGAALEYTFNLEFELQRKGVREKARVIYLTNEAELGDLGVGGMMFDVGGFETHSKTFTESLFVERGVDWILGAHVRKIERNQLEYEDLQGDILQLQFDFAMLLPPFRGVPLKAFAKDGAEITERLFNAGGFMRVDGNYASKPYEEWDPADWPRTYQTEYKNIFSIGIAFAPPHQISKPRKNKHGTLIAPAPPRTGMPSATMGRAVALSIVDMISGNSMKPTRSASMAELGAACIASAGAHPLYGTAASITMFPIIPDLKKYPRAGRSLMYTTGEIGLAGHWIKHLLHYAFMYKAKAHPFWWLIPE